MVPLMNYSNVDYIVECNERIAQLVAINTQTINFQQVDSMTHQIDLLVDLDQQEKINLFNH
jgi:dUTPase